MQKSENAQKETIDRMMNTLLENLEFGSNQPIFTTSLENGKPMLLWEKNAQVLTELTLLMDIDLKICKLLLHRKIVQKATKRNLFYGVKGFINLLFLKLILRYFQVLRKQVQKQVSTETTFPPSLMEKEPKLADITGTSEIIGNIYQNPDLLTN
jgi:hypothetical protein